MHEHKFFLFQVKADFEPLPTKIKDGVNLTKDLYRRTEYAILSCACGEAVKTKVKQDNEQS